MNEEKSFDQSDEQQCAKNKSRSETSIDKQDMEELYSLQRCLSKVDSLPDIRLYLKNQILNDKQGSLRA